MATLTTRYLGLALRSPLVASSSPLTGSLDGLKRLEDAGIAACVLPSLFEEELDPAGLDALPEGPLELLRRAKETLSVPVLASLNGASEDGWVEYARLLEQAGADALELNVYRVPADPVATSEQIEGETLAVVSEVRRTLRIPLAVKLGPGFTALASFARRLVAAGADGLVLFNRFYQPDVDLETLTVTAQLTLSSREELRLPLRWIGILRGQIEASLAATSGIHEPEDVVKALLAGADVTMMASALLEHGSAHVTTVERGLVRWLESHEHGAVGEIRGRVSRATVTDPEAFERGNYLRTLRSWNGGD